MENKSKYGFFVVERNTMERIKFFATLLSAKSFIFQLEEDDKEFGFYVPNKYGTEAVVYE